LIETASNVLSYQLRHVDDYWSKIVKSFYIWHYTPLV